MIAWFTAGLLMGAVGSLHCVGMCGPLALNLPAVHSSAASRFAGTLLYNLGRVLTYTLLGAVLGGIGYSFVLLGFQQWLSIGLGAGMLIYLLLPSHYKTGVFSLKFLSPLRKKMGSLYSQPSYTSLVSIGVLNGLLPCGLVYTALAMAVAGGDFVNSAFFMAAFGLGTLPMMWLVAFFGGSMNWNFRLKIRKAYPYVVLVMACLLILRGMNLGIPYISPGLQATHEHAADLSCHD